MKINPVFMKDLRSNVRSPKFATIIFVYTLCLGLLSVMFLYAGMQKPDGQQVFNYENCNQFTALIGGIELAVILFVVPMLTSGTIASEKERQTLDYLLISKLRPFHIICGKIAYALTAAFVFIISSFPANSIIISTGAVPVKVHFQMLSLFVVTAIFSASIGMFFSALKKKTIPAIALTYMFLVALTLGTIVIYNLNQYILEDMSLASSKNSETLPWMFLLNPVATYCYIILEFSSG
ncbi:MAG: ABC transporter permease, partial [Clostridium sp.]|nr:ABC transporter permease [Clostridium sp.]